jgi:hypothetical protein
VNEEQQPRPPLFVIKGDATDEEIAALTAVLQAMAASAAAARAAEKRSRPEWSTPRRGLRQPLFHGRGGWRASSIPG